MLILLSTLLLAQGVESSLIQAALGVLIILLVSIYGREVQDRDTIDPPQATAPMPPEEDPVKLYIGTYSRPAPYLASTNGTGPDAADADPVTGRLCWSRRCRASRTPSYLCISPDGRNLHAVSEVFDWPEGLAHCLPSIRHGAPGLPGCPGRRDR